MSGYGTGTCKSVIPISTTYLLYLLTLLTDLLTDLLTYLLGLPLDADPRSDAGGAPASQVASCAAAPHASMRGCRREARVHLCAQPVYRYVEMYRYVAQQALPAPQDAWGGT